MKKKESTNEKFIDNYPIQVSISSMEKILFQMKKCVCKIYTGNSTGTGFFCKIYIKNKAIKTFITNNHVLDKSYLNSNKIIQISLDDENKMGIITINEKLFNFTDESLDITILEIDENNEINKYVEYLEIDNRIYNDKEYYNDLFEKKPIYTMNYAKGKNILASYGIFKSMDIDSNFIRHTCSTDTGSSGAPIILLDSLKVIGIHSTDSRLNYNTGIFMKNTISLFVKNFEKNQENRKIFAKINTNKINMTKIQRNNKYLKTENNKNNSIYQPFINDKIKLNQFSDKNNKNRANDYNITKRKNIIEDYSYLLRKNENNINNNRIISDHNINKLSIDKNKKSSEITKIHYYATTNKIPNKKDTNIYEKQSYHKLFKNNNQNIYLISDYQSTKSHNIIYNNINNNKNNKIKNNNKSKGNIEGFHFNNKSYISKFRAATPQFSRNKDIN
jgi:hypothetical protein